MKKYQLIEEKYLKDIDANIQYLKHIKSGARVLLIKNDDPNKVFCVSFRTPPADDTGVPHILEHSTLCGSKKFPVKDPFVELIKSSLNTFINAFTAPDKTMYPVASCNLKDFKNLMEVYMDAVFYPNVYIHEEIFKQEGWHYELESPESDLIYNGVVYNEMKGAFSNPEEVLDRQTRHELFPDNAYGVESGGDPEAIPNLTYEQFKNFHSKYYSPSNSYIVIYGNLDMEERLEWMDKEYLSKFDKIDVDSDIPFQKPFDKIKFAEYKYPIGKDDTVDNKAYYSYGLSIGTYKDMELSTAMEILSYTLLDAPGAPLKQALLDKGLGVEVNSMYLNDIKQPEFTITTKNAPLGKEKEFLETIEDTLRKISKEGIDKDSLLSAINYYEFRSRELDFGRFPKGLVFTMSATKTWLYDENDPTGGLDVIKYYSIIKEKLNTRYFEDIIDKYLLNNNHKVVVTLTPSNTLALENEAKTKEKLKKFKESLSKEDINKLVEDTKHLKEYQQEPSSPQDLASMPKLTRDDIDKNAEKMVNDVIDIDKVKVVKHNIFTNGITYLTFSFDTSKLPNELVPYLNILCEAFGKVDTEHYSYQKLYQDININTGGISPSFRTVNKKDGYLPLFEINARVFDDKLKFVFDILKEIILTSKYNNEKRMKEIVQEYVSSKQGAIIGAGHRHAILRAQSYYSESSAYLEAISGIEAYKFAERMIKNFDINDLNNKLNEVVNTIFRKENLIVSYTNNNDDYKKYLSDFSSSLYNMEYKQGHFIFKKDLKNEAFKVPSQVQYVAMSDNVSSCGDYTASLDVLGTNLSYDYLWVQVRVLGGAYGVMYNSNKDGKINLVTYRDPNLSRSLEVFRGIPNFIDSLELNDEQLTSSIISAIGNLDTPRTPRTKGDVSYTAYLSQTSDEELQQYRNQVLNTTLEDIKKLKTRFEELIKDPAICVIGSESKIEEDAKDFKEIKNLFE